MSDDDLLRRLTELLSRSRRVEAELVAHIGEVDARKLYAREACSSMFAYCAERLHLSEFEAYLRIAVARACRQHPTLLEMLGDGRMHLSGIDKLAPHLTESNRDRLLARAVHKSKRQIEELVAELKPRPDVPTVVRKLPERRSRATLTAPSVSLPPVNPRPEQLGPDPVTFGNTRSRREPTTSPPEPLSPSRYRVQFTADAELNQKLQRLRALTGEADLAVVIDAAVSEKLERLEARRFAKTDKPRKTVEESDTSPRSRHIPAAVRRAVTERDGNRCSFVDDRGRRCTERNRLEFHHRKPFGRGGARNIDNIFLTCRAHNIYFAEQDYGKTLMRRYLKPADRVSEQAPSYGPPASTAVVALQAQCPVARAKPALHSAQ